MSQTAEPAVPHNRLEEKWPQQIDCALCASTLAVGLDDLSCDHWRVAGHFFAVHGGA